MNTVNKIDFLGIKVDALTKDELVEKILEFALSGKHKMITYLNSHCVNISFSDKDYREILSQSNIIYPDGKVVIWASRILKRPLPERIDAVDLFNGVAEKAGSQSIGFYFLGGKPDRVQKAANNINGRFPGLKILGLHHGYFDDKEEENVIEEINSLKPHILMIGMGVPNQEKWISRHLNGLEVNLCWAAGGIFDNLSGFLSRAPKWMSDTGIEWLYRLFQEPRRLWKRYLIGNFIFVFRILKSEAKEMSFQ